MADLTITTGNVGVHANAQTLPVTFGGSISPGDCVYLDTDGEYKLADSDGDDTGSQTTATVSGVAITAGGDGESGIIVVAGEMDLGATLTVGEIYVVSAAAAGGIAPYSDLVSNDYVSVIGIATAADKIDVQIHVSDVQVP